MTDSALGNLRPALRWNGAIPTTLIALLLVLASVTCRDLLPWQASYPKELVIPYASGINYLSDHFSAFLQPLSRSFAWLLAAPMASLRSALLFLPWPILVLFIVTIAYHAEGRGLAIFALVFSVYLVLTGYWAATMNTMVLVLLAVPISAALGFGIGIVAHWSQRLRPSIELALDLMQTVPAFAYLIPLLILFGFGPVVGLIASVIFAVPPMVRNTMLGLSLVPQAIQESSRMSGCTRWQQFWLADVPTAKPQLLVGVNQTTMAAFSMVIIGSLAGGSDDIGWEVLSAVRQAEFGRSLLSGLVIALAAMLIDRITLGFAKGGRRRSRSGKAPRGYRLATFLGSILAVGIGFRSAVGNPDWLAGTRQFINMKLADDALLALVRDHAALIETVRNNTISFLMLPIRVGLEKAVTKFTWGMEITPAFIAVYLIFAGSAALVIWKKWGWRPAVVAVWAVFLLYFGVTTFPWLGLVITLTFLCWRVANARLAFFTLATLLFAVTSGLWLPTMQSFYLCILAILISFLAGGSLGFWAAHNDTVSRGLRPICDALQTMPQFVFLIPALMFFKVGDLTALIAVVLYAIVPPIRYVEHGLRHLPTEVVEAGIQAGCTPSQLLWRVKVPLALPGILLGLNQTIMAALSMLAVAALVGTRDLGQQVYIALGKADAGMGLAAGVMIALIAIVSDRVIRCWCLKRQKPGAA